eukprot:CAMPEP_0177507924 /NCGR_PEP_ID=MMETSP0369-20130122/40748_1 /TAXON_ID=447022 ORGANISM="Scrippsiella hangoei-like, Strain SHHI-4" /NCGR_SAMPLE_ID=MMETSP0369 /ASSEMBLY_ACC=CAM_ASM_000364 /LENGTH=190 /DNA_ID=CAMNT_0018985991 /DNA_START=117 /DNA_END=689 /DNA_ORIENTATION=-
MEQDAFWRFEDTMQRGRLATVGAGTLGSGTLGSTKLKTSETLAPVGGALLRTMSMPIVAAVPPCGMRVGSDLLGDVPENPGNTITALRRKPQLEGVLEDRLQLLERSFKGGTPSSSRLGTCMGFQSDGRRTSSRMGTAGSMRSDLQSRGGFSSRPASSMTSLPRCQSGSSLGRVSSLCPIWDEAKPGQRQ